SPFHTPDPHSFPTRRSSDLDAQNGSISMILGDAFETLKGKSLRALIWATDKAGKRLEATWVFHIPEQQLPVNPPPAAQPSSLARSEEHTSELQSLAYLVCRL